MFLISLGTEQDIEGIYTISKHFDRGNPKEFYEEQLTHSRVIVAKIDEKVIGYLTYQYIWGDTTLLSLIQILPEHHRQGVGTQLIDYFEERLREKGITEYISSSTIGKDIAYAFHKNLGLEEIGVLEMRHGKERFYRKHITQ